MNNFVSLKSDRLGSCPADKGNRSPFRLLFERNDENGNIMKEIRMFGGGHIKVDDDDFDYLDKFTWYKRETAFYYYAKARINGKSVYMHKLLIENEEGKRILHINGDGLDNRKSNLKISTYYEFNIYNPRRRKYTDEEYIEIKKLQLRKANKKRKENGKRSIYFKDKYKNNIQYRIKRRLYIALWNVLNKETHRCEMYPKYEELFGCNKKYLKNHIELQFRDGMNWNNHSLTGWQIDHIIPISAFDLTDEDQCKKCFHYTNLQPLWVEENMKKGNKIIET